MEKTRRDVAVAVFYIALLLSVEPLAAKRVHKVFIDAEPSDSAVPSGDFVSEVDGLPSALHEMLSGLDEMPWASGDIGGGFSSLKQQHASLHREGIHGGDHRSSRNRSQHKNQSGLGGLADFFGGSSGSSGKKSKILSSIEGALGASEGLEEIEKGKEVPSQQSKWKHMFEQLLPLARFSQAIGPSLVVTGLRPEHIHGRCKAIVDEIEGTSGVKDRIMRSAEFMQRQEGVFEALANSKTSADSEALGVLGASFWKVADSFPENLNPSENTQAGGGNEKTPKHKNKTTPRYSRWRPTSSPWWRR